MDEIKSNENSNGTKKRKRIKRGARLTARIESLAFGGAGVARVDGGIVLFVAGALPGDFVKVVVTKRKKGHLEARVLELIEPGPDRIEPRCEHFELCGGCKWQSYPYELQLETKRQQVIDHFTRIAGIEDPPIEPIVGMENPWEYRNKMDYTFSSFKDGGLKLGLHQPGFFDRVIKIDRCFLQTRVCDDVRNETLAFCEEHGLSTRDARSGEGLMRNLVIRVADGNVMACVSTSTDEFASHAEEFAERLTSKIPEIKSLFWYVNPLLSGVALAGEAHLLAGAPSLTERLMGLELKLSPLSFMQTNTVQCEELYSTLLEFADFDGSETVFDVYTGMAPIAMLAARRVKRVVGIESVPEAIADGRFNLEANSTSNVELIEGAAEKVLPELCEKEKPDVIITDPPRVGMHKKALKAVIGAEPGRVVYVSCNPSTLARDAALLAEAGYSLEKLRPVDMFPHTAHIECVALFTLNRK